MTKPEIRKKYKALRRELSASEIDNYSLNLSNQLLKLDIWQFSTYHVFLSIVEYNEIDTHYILNILSGKDKNIVVSKSNFEDSSMTHYLLTDNTTIKKNEYNIPEPLDGIEVKPEQIDVVFVPLLAYDKLGNRIGYGKGFYDRFLALCKPKTLKIGLSFFEPHTDKFEVSTNDITLDYCVTPSRVIRFQKTP